MSNKHARVLVLIVGGVLAAGFLNGFGLWPFDPPPPRAAPRAAAPNPMAGCSLAKQAVTQRLKSPSTAKFDECWRKGELVCLNVDSQNGFGTTILSTWLVRFDSGESVREVVNVATMRCLQ